MKLWQLFLAVAVISERKSSADGYTVCGNSTRNAEEVKEAVDEIVKRFMTVRAPDWGWDSMSTITAIQVAAPKKLFARKKVVALMKDIIRYDWDHLHILDLAELSFVAKSLCMNPRRIRGRDLLEKIHDGMFHFLANTTDVEPEHVIEYSLALSSLCINNYPLDSNLVEELLSAQNEDGSFGTEEDQIDYTIFMIRPIYCLTQMERPAFNVTKVEAALRKTRDFTKKYVKRKEDQGAIIGTDEITSSDALIGLYKSIEPGDVPDKDWLCSEVMDTLGLFPKPDEDEYHLHDKLLRITGTDYLDLMSKDYKCIETDPIPPGYKPTCNYEKPESCGIVEEVPK